MAKFESSIYEAPYWKKPSRSSLALVVGLLLLSLGWLLKELAEPLSNGLMILGCLLLILHQRFDFGKKPITGKALGELLINAEGTLVRNELIPYSDVKTFRIWFGDYKMKKIYSRLIGYYFHSGTENHFSIELKNNSCIKHHFMVFNQNHETDLKRSLKNFYSNEIFVFEQGEKGRCYLGEELDYEEIQEFKKKYNLKGTGYE